MLNWSNGGHPLKNSIWSHINIDFALLLPLCVLTGFGLTLLYSASGGSQALVTKQLLALGLGFLAMMVVAQLPIFLVRRSATLLLVITVLLLVIVALFGVDARGAQRWLQLPGGFRFQPSELAKITVPIALASYLSRNPLPPRIDQVAISFLILSIPVVLISIQPDLGTAILIASSGLLVLFLAGWPWKQITALLAALVLFMPLVWSYVLRDYQKSRILTVFNAENDPLGAGWNSLQSKAAIGSGGLWGHGWQQGPQSQLNFLPEGHTDFIIAVLAEEQGLIGVVGLLTLYMLIISRGLYISANCNDTFQSLLSGGIVLTFFIYIFVNVGMVSGLLPVVGIPLPLISMGGSSMVTLLLSFGLLMSIQSHKRGNI